MDDESALREKARDAIRSGRLPYRDPEHMWGGPGVGSCCAICGETVSREEQELELEFTRDGDRAAPIGYHVHIQCFAAWKSELENLGAHAVRGASSKPVRSGALPPAAHCETSESSSAIAESRRALPVMGRTIAAGEPETEQRR